jgi:predicted Zn-dependent protease
LTASREPELAADAGNWADAARRAQRGLEHAPEQPVLRAILARAMLHFSSNSEPHDPNPIDAVVTPLRKPDAPAQAMALVAEVELARARSDTALLAAEAAVARNDECIPCLETLARVRHQLGDDAAAISALSRAVAVWPHESEPKRLLAKLAEYRNAAAAQP